MDRSLVQAKQQRSRAEVSARIAPGMNEAGDATPVWSRPDHPRLSVPGRMRRGNAGSRTRSCAGDYGQPPCIRRRGAPGRRLHASFAAAPLLRVCSLGIPAADNARNPPADRLLVARVSISNDTKRSFQT
jgi:hypothetical protein